jgi:hypothetical protein
VPTKVETTFAARRWYMSVNRLAKDCVAAITTNYAVPSQERLLKEKDVEMAIVRVATMVVCGKKSASRTFLTRQRTARK